MYKLIYHLLKTIIHLMLHLMDIIKRKIIKLSLIVDSNGVPLSALLVKGNKYDLKIMNENKNIF